jgi:phosphatidylinositol-3-phosphatase
MEARHALRATAALCLVALVAGCASSPTPGTSATPPATTPPSATAPTPSASTPSPSSAAATPSLAVSSAHPCVGAATPGRYDHVVWIVMENKDASAATGGAAPFTASLAGACAQAADAHGVTHPSLPNYLALATGSTHGVQDDAAPSAHPIAGPSVFSQAAAAGIGWATYAESMPGPCVREPVGRYAVKHNPAAYLTALAPTCAAHDVPLGTTTSGPLATGLRDGTLPGMVLVVPDLCSDTHDCPVATGDAWLRSWLAAITSSRVYAAGRTAVMVTWDEGEGSADNSVALLVVAPSVVPGTVVHGRLDHLSVLRTTEELLGLPTTLAPSATSFRAAAHL